MNNFTKTLLAGAALAALGTVPAVAMPNIHVQGVSTSKIPLQVKVGSQGHVKTNIHDPKYSNFTETLTFSSYLTTGFYKTPVMLYGETWIAGSDGDCTTIPGQKLKLSTKKTAAGKIKAGSETGYSTYCNATLTYYGPIYTLSAKSPTTDSFVAYDTAKHTASGYNLDLVENNVLTIE